MVVALWFTILLTLLVSKMGMSMSSLRNSCYADSDCKDGNYCVMDSGFCNQCMDCSFYQRMQSHRGCVKTPKQCGECKPGFVDQYLGNDDQGLSFFCVVGNKTSGESNISIFPGGPIPYIITAAIFLFIAASLLATYIYKKTNCKDHLHFPRHTQCEVVRDTIDVQTTLLSGPPTYSQAISSAPLQIPGNFIENGYHDEQSTTGLVICRKERETTQAATVYRIPSCERRINLIRDDNNSDRSSSHSLEQSETEQLIDQDENTIESNWSSNVVAVPYQETNLSVALSEATGIRIIVQPSEEDPAPETASPPKRMRTQEDASKNDLGHRNSENSESTSIVIPDTARNIDYNENILNQGTSSSTRYPEYNHRRSTRHHIPQDGSQSSDEDDTPRVETENNFYNVVVIKQSMKIQK